MLAKTPWLGTDPMNTPTSEVLEPQQGVLPFASPDAAADWLAQPIERFTAWRRTMKAANGYAYDARSIRQHVAMWAGLVAYCASHGLTIQTVAPAHLEAFLTQLRGRAIKFGQATPALPEGECPAAAASTRRRYAQLLETTFEHLIKIRVRRGNPMAPVMATMNKPTAPGFVSFLTKSEEDAFLASVDAIDESDWHRQRDKVLMLLLCASGVTEGELVALRIADVSLRDYEPALQVGERGLKHAHTTTINDFALPALRRWLTTLDAALPHTPLFPSVPGGSHPMLARDVYLTTRATLEASGFNGKQRGPQTVRNTFIRRQIYFGVKYADINAWVGLESDKTIRKLKRTLPNLQGTRPA